MKYSEISLLDSHQLKQKRAELQKQLWELQLKKSVSPGAIKDVSVFRTIRRAIARIQFRLSLDN